MTLDFTGWERDAACVDKPTEWFFPDREGRGTGGQYDKGRAVCADCPVRVECLNDALSKAEGYGLRGGLTPRERGTYRRRARFSEALALGSRRVP